MLCYLAFCAYAFADDVDLQMTKYRIRNLREEKLLCLPKSVFRLGIHEDNGEYPSKVFIKWVEHATPEQLEMLRVFEREMLRFQANAKQDLDPERRRHLRSQFFAHPQLLSWMLADEANVRTLHEYMGGLCVNSKRSNEGDHGPNIFWIFATARADEIAYWLSDTSISKKHRSIMRELTESLCEYVDAQHRDSRLELFLEAVHQLPHRIWDMLNLGKESLENVAKEASKAVDWVDERASKAVAVVRRQSFDSGLSASAPPRRKSMSDSSQDIWMDMMRTMRQRRHHEEGYASRFLDDFDERDASPLTGRRSLSERLRGLQQRLTFVRDFDMRLLMTDLQHQCHCEAVVLVPNPASERRHLLSPQVVVRDTELSRDEQLELQNQIFDAIDWECSTGTPAALCVSTSWPVQVDNMLLDQRFQKHSVRRANADDRWWQLSLSQLCVPVFEHEPPTRVMESSEHKKGHTSMRSTIKRLKSSARRRSKWRASASRKTDGDDTDAASRHVVGVLWCLNKFKFSGSASGIPFHGRDVLGAEDCALQIGHIGSG